MISSETIETILNISIQEPFTCKTLGLLNEKKDQMLSFIDCDHFIYHVNHHPSLKAVFTLDTFLDQVTSEVVCIPHPEPRYAYYLLREAIEKSALQFFPSQIHDSVDISERASVSETSVIIEEGVIIEDHVVIHPNVHIGKHCIIQSGSVIGQNGFEYIETSKGLHQVQHYGKTILNDNVSIGSNTCIDSGTMDKETIIGSGTKVGNNVQVSFGALLGNWNMISHQVSIGSHVSTGKHVHIHPLCRIENNSHIGHDSYIYSGSVVSSNIPSCSSVSMKLHHTLSKNKLHKKYISS